MQRNYPFNRKHRHPKGSGWVGLKDGQRLTPNEKLIRKLDKERGHPKVASPVEIQVSLGLVLVVILLVFRLWE
jgi:hypothetical protein